MTDIEELEKKVEEKKQQESNEFALTSKINNSISECYDNTLANNTDKMQALTNKLFNAEVEVKENQIEGRKEVLKAKTEKEVTQAKTEVDVEKTERAKTILKAQGLTEKLPPIFRVTALVFGFPFFIIYLLTFGWVIEFLTFMIKGFMTMIYDCADKFSTLNKKFIENNNNQDFKLGKAIFNILKWIVIVTGIVIALIFIIN